MPPVYAQVVEVSTASSKTITPKKNATAIKKASASKKKKTAVEETQTGSTNAVPKRGQVVKDSVTGRKRKENEVLVQKVRKKKQRSSSPPSSVNRKRKEVTDQVQPKKTKLSTIATDKQVQSDTCFQCTDTCLICNDTF